ncbi:hypothetical protein [Lysobacter sp. Hz 25]|uniref:hypothetical protein n=1 Tax=Lysobacter sp. Hz 25 TaxID=3383698 RepID=UPI0038D4198E
MKILVGYERVLGHGVLAQAAPGGSDPTSTGVKLSDDPWRRPSAQFGSFSPGTP